VVAFISTAMNRDEILSCQYNYLVEDSVQYVDA